MDRISRRALNRTTLGRQLLLKRSDMAVADAVEHLVGMQAQNPHDPYYALWSRLDGFEPSELSGMIEEREAVRGALMRATLHLATTPDYASLRSQLRPTVAAVLGSTSFARDTETVERQALLARGRSLLEERPMTRAELAPLLEETWPGIPGASLAQVVTYLLPVIQVTPRGLWGRTGPAAWTTIESWAGVEVPAQSQVEQTVIRYLAAFGPASIADIRVWSRLSGLRPVVEKMRSGFRVLHGEDGSELLDLPDAPVFDEGTPAPPRFLPEYDNVLLGHSDRSRFFLPEVVPPGWVGNLLVEGLFSGWWKIARSRNRAEVEVCLLRAVPRAEMKAVGEEAERLLIFAQPEAGVRDVLLRQDR